MKSISKYNKSEVMTEAWKMYNDYNNEISFKECLKWSWNLTKGIVTNGITKEANIATIKDVVYMNANSTDFLHIMYTVRDNSNGFQKDIAIKALNGEDISEKQAWCVAYEYKKVA